jgi:hypothetical protein
MSCFLSLEVRHATSRQVGVANSGARTSRDSIYRMRTILRARFGHTDTSHITDNTVNGRPRSVRDAANHDL